MNTVKVNGFEIRQLVMGSEPETYVLNIFGQTDGVAEDMKKFGAVAQTSAGILITIKAATRSGANVIRNRIVETLTPAEEEPEATQEAAI